MKKYEIKLLKQGFKNIAGLDEAGRGCWAGPLVVALCVLKNDFKSNKIFDSKKMNEKQRNEAYQLILDNAKIVDYVIYDSNFVDKNNPKRSSIIGMEYLINKNKKNIDFCLIDAEKINTHIPNLSIIKGDSLSLTIAAASIIAKVTRDKIMKDLDKLYPQYNFSSNKGYGTKEHLKSLKEFGPIKNIHRFSYKPIKEIKSK